MADFLTRLAERTLGVASVVQPIIAPVFAPEPVLTSDTHLLQRENTPVVQSILAPEPASATEAQRLQREEMSLNTAHDDMVPARDRFSPTTLRMSRRHPINSEASEHGADQSFLEYSQGIHAHPEHLVHVPRDVSPEQENPRHRIVPTLDTTIVSDQGAATPTLGIVPSSITLVPAQNEVSPGTSPSTDWTLLTRSNARALPSVQHLEASATEKSASAPIIRVTIGRIEVRSIMPAKEPAVRPPSPRPGPKLSLDDYLKQQNGGQR